MRLVDGQPETVVDTVLDAFNARVLAILPSAPSCIYRAVAGADCEVRCGATLPHDGRDVGLASSSPSYARISARDDDALRSSVKSFRRDQSFPATIYARVGEVEDAAHNPIWSHSKGD